MLFFMSRDVQHINYDGSVIQKHERGTAAFLRVRAALREHGQAQERIGRNALREFNKS
jgi:hypothetical protein